MLSFLWLALLCSCQLDVAFPDLSLPESCDLFIAPSRFLENGMGIFAGRKIDKRSSQPPGVTLYVKPIYGWQLNRYVFAPFKDMDSEYYGLLEFGPAMIYNHHEYPNIEHHIQDEWASDDEYSNNVIVPQVKMFQLLEANTVYPLNFFQTLTDIQPGEEIFYDYGSTWFEETGIPLRQPTKEQTSYASVEMLRKVGHCVSDIYTAPSLITSEEPAGQGVFASVNFQNGEFVDISPVLIHPKHEVIETSDELSVLINFCFSRPGSDVALLPIGYAAVCNHGGKKLANVAIEWYFWGGNYNESALERDPEYMIKSDFAELYFGYRALRDIKKDEEILIDYGDDWEADWNIYLHQKRDFVRFHQPVPLFRRAIDMPAHMFSNKWHVDCIGASCINMTDDQKKNPTYKRAVHIVPPSSVPPDILVPLKFTSVIDGYINLYSSIDSTHIATMLKDDVAVFEGYIGERFIAQRGEEVVGEFTVGNTVEEQIFLITYHQTNDDDEEL